MTAAEVETPGLFHSPLGLFQFQAEGASVGYWRMTETERPVQVFHFDTGTGKTVLSIALSCLLIEDQKIDHIIIVAEANKVIDWADVDYPEFSDLKAVKYTGLSPTKREAMAADLPQVMVTSYETLRGDTCTFKVDARGKTTNYVGEPKFLTEALVGKRVLIVFDEFSRLKKRNNKLYAAVDYLINKRLRRSGVPPMVIGLTATPVETTPEDDWNARRVLAPDLAGTVAAFHENYVAAYDNYGLPCRFKNLIPSETQVGILPLSEMFREITIRKRKTDPDVMAQFPRKIENPPTKLLLSSKVQEFYDAVDEMMNDEALDPFVQRQAYGILRQLVGHPMSLIRAGSAITQSIVATVGAGYIEGLPSVKTEAMMRWLERMGDQQTVIFTFYGQSILPLLAHEMRGKGYEVVVNHGQMSLGDRQIAQEQFKAGKAQVFLSSDAGAKGLNLGCGSGLLHYEYPPTKALYDQRSDRIHRINSIHPSVTVDGLLVDRTLEVGVHGKMEARGEWGAKITDGDAWNDEADELSALGGTII